MEINHEILACYLDGTSTNEERNLVRKYLCENPLHYQELLSLIERTQLSSLTDEDFNCRNYGTQSPDTQLPDALSTDETKNAASNCISIFRSINTSGQNCKNTKYHANDRLLFIKGHPCKSRLFFQYIKSSCTTFVLQLLLLHHSITTGLTIVLPLLFCGFSSHLK